MRHLSIALGLAAAADGSRCDFGDLSFVAVLDSTAAELSSKNHSVRRLAGSPLLPWTCADDNPLLRAEKGCFFQNPASPYAFLEAPRSDGGPFEDEPKYHHFKHPNKTGAGSGQRDHQWRMASHEAVVLAGCTPPPMKYFGFAPLLSARHSSTGKLRRAFGAGAEGEWEVVAGSIGDAVNLRNIATYGHSGSGSGGRGPFNAPFVLVLSASPEAEAAAVQALGAALGASAAACVNVLRIPGRFRDADALFRSADINLGHGPRADLFEVLVRFAFPESAAAFTAYLDDSPLGLLKVSLAAGSKATPFPPLPRKARTLPPPPPSNAPGEPAAAPHAVSEWPLAGRVAALADLLAAETGGGRFVAVRSPLALLRRSVPDDGAAGCVLDERFGLATGNCQGDTRDTAYRLGLPLFTLDAGEFVAAVGVNHARAGMALYSNVALYDLKGKRGVLDVHDGDMAGTGRPASARGGVASEGTDDDALFAVTFAFDCSVVPPGRRCWPVPLAPGTPMALVERAYLHPATGLGPDEAAMVPMRLIVFKKRAQGSIAVHGGGGSSGGGSSGGGVGSVLALAGAWRATLRGIPRHLLAKMYVGAAVDLVALYPAPAAVAATTVLALAAGAVLLVRPCFWGRMLNP